MELDCCHYSFEIFVLYISQFSITTYICVNRIIIIITLFIYLFVHFFQLLMCFYTSACL
jgi:hypothetical protein